MTSKTWDIVPATVNSRSEKPAETGPFPARAEPTEIEAIPVTLSPGAVIHATFNGERVVLVGTAPTGLTAILCPRGWRGLQAWKITRLRTRQGRLYAAGTGRAGGFDVGRFLLGAPASHAVYQRNGNLLDARLSNLVAIPRGLLRQANIEAARGPDYKNPDVRWVDENGGVHHHSGKPVTIPSAGERVAKLRYG